MTIYGVKGFKIVGFGELGFSRVVDECFFSLPEHNVLRVSYCNQSMCIHLSVNNYLKNLL